MGLESDLEENWIPMLNAILKAEILDSHWLLIKVILLVMLVSCLCVPRFRILIYSIKADELFFLQVDIMTSVFRYLLGDTEHELSKQVAHL